MPITDPTDISGLMVWFDADAIGGLSDGDPVTTWEDSSPNNRDATPGSFGSPTYQTGEQNGLPVVRFDGVDDRLETSGFAWNQPATVFIVCKFTAAYAARDTLMDGAGTIFTRFFARSSSTTMQIYAGSATVDSAATTPESCHVYTTVFNGASSAIYVDSGSASSGNAGSVGATGIALGALGGAGGEYSPVDVAEVVGYDTALSTGDRQDVIDYLTAKWLTAPPEVPTMYVVQGAERMA